MLVANNQQQSVIFEHDAALMAKVLKCYFDHTQYLKHARVEKHGDIATGGKITVTGHFAIDESCYIEDTGHFNAVEFNICYNQIMYYGIAKAVKHGLFGESFAKWTLEHYFEKQLPDVLIVNFQSTFKRGINARNFKGEIDFVTTRTVTKGQGMLFVKTLCRFYDDEHGYSEGCVDLAIVNLVT
jgi:hypothetical protein